MQTITQLFKTTRGGKYQQGRCEVCDEVLGPDEIRMCQDCEFQDQLEEERNH